MGIRRIIIAVLTCALIAVPTAVAARDPGPYRILLVGDSTTQGSAGDWTWRYRLWQHLDGEDVDFVGTRNDLFDQVAGRQGSLEYADADFDTDHSAVWGRTLTEQVELIEDLVALEQPDIVLVLMGVNDLCGLGATPLQVMATLHALIDKARLANPGLAFVVGTLPWPWIPGTQLTNGYFAELGPALSTPESPVLIADLGTMTEGVHTYDRVHLSAAGEMQVAAGFADQLALLGVGRPYPRPLPVVPNVPRRVAIVDATAGDGMVSLQWTNPPGATQETVWLRDVSTGDAWDMLALPVVGPFLQVGPLANHHVFMFRLQASKGSITSDLFSEEVTATPRPTHLQGLLVMPVRHGLHLRWEPVLNASGYIVTWSHGASATTAMTELTVSHLRAGHPYLVTVRPVSGEDSSASVTAVPTGPTPKAPRRVTVRGCSVRWTARKTATRYEVLWQGQHMRWTRRTHVCVRTPGWWEIRAWHHDIGGGSTRVFISAAPERR